MRLAAAVGAVAEAGWALRRRLLAEADASDPPMTRFVVEQLATAHWFDQRETRRLLGWGPRISFDEGLAELARWFREQHSP